MMLAEAYDAASSACALNRGRAGSLVWFQQALRGPGYGEWKRKGGLDMATMKTRYRNIPPQLAGCIAESGFGFS
jgi:hypothetical protein